MINTLVVPLDDAELSDRAVPIAAVLACPGGADIRLVGISHDEGDFASTYERVHETARSINAAGCVDVRVDAGGDPAAMLLDIASDPTRVLCFACDEHLDLVSSLSRSVGSHLLERATHPLVVVGPEADAGALTRGVVVALDGIHDPEPILSAAVAWALQLNVALRIVTVYEPVPADVRRPDHFTRLHGPACEPTVYLGALQRRVTGSGVNGVEMAAIPDPVSVADGLASFLEDWPARLLVVGGRHTGPHVSPGVLGELLRTTRSPALVVPPTRRHHGGPRG